MEPMSHAVAIDGGKVFTPFVLFVGALEVGWIHIWKKKFSRFLHNHFPFPVHLTPHPKTFTQSSLAESSRFMRMRFEKCLSSFVKLSSLFS